VASALPLEKASPADAARAIVAGIIAGDRGDLPDKMSQGTGPAFFTDPKGLERQLAGVKKGNIDEGIHPRSLRERRSRAG